jgi:putative CocE/NonD family hydrolase
VSYGKDKEGKPVDGFNYFLDRGSFAKAVEESGSKMLPTWKLFLDHPAYDCYWKSIGVEYSLKSARVPVLTVGGTYDQEDMYGPQEQYASLEPHDAQHRNFLVLAPWKHGYWSSSSRHLGNVDYTQPVGKQFRSRIEARFFAHYLKDEPGFDVHDTASFRTGSNRWMYYDHFPPPESRPTNLYLLGGGALGWNPSPTKAATSYVSNPANPVPYRHRPIQPTYSDGSAWYDWLTEDQRFVTGRSDVAVWKLPPLQKDLVLAGEVAADIFASTTGSDNDLVVKLIDQYPDNDADPKMRGYQLMINAEIFRGRYLKSFEKPSAVRPNAIREYKFSLHAADHVFKAGHTVMVEIQSSWFPLYDRNPQTFVSNIMKAQPRDYRPATISIYSSPGHNSVLRAPVEGGCASAGCS